VKLYHHFLKSTKNKILTTAVVPSRAINYMALARGPAADYDAWAELVGDHSWRWENIIPLIKDVKTNASSWCIRDRD
jgi:choline dehydrogenase-like flavoprotein